MYRHHVHERGKYQETHRRNGHVKMGDGAVINL
jgi:hypothetical protein